METGWNSEQLLAEMDWVRRLARALLRDAALADDVAQEAWLVAYAHQPDDDRPLRPWLARVVKTLVRTRRRGEHRRGLRELASDTERPVPKPDELVERVELQRAVSAEVLALPEPHRSTLLLHYFEGMSSADIARRLGIPDATVRRRLATGLANVRQALQKRENPPQGGWLAALIPIAGVPDPRVVPAASAFGLMKLVAGVIIVAILILGGVKYLRGRHDTNASDDRARGAATASAPRHVAPVPGWLAQPEVAARRIAGHVRAGGAPASGATVRLGAQVGDNLLQQLAEITVDADGAFDFGPQPAVTFTVSASAVDHSPAAVVVANADPYAKPGELVLDLGDCKATLLGKVSDSSGGVIAKARLSVAGLGGTDTDSAGRYTMCLDSTVPAQLVRVEADGYGSIAEGVIAVGTLRHDFVLVPEGVLVGSVVDEANHPVPGARVIAEPDAVEDVHHAASSWADCDRDGRFRISGLQPAKFQLLATAPQLAMAAPVPAIARATQTSHELRLVVAATARIRGHVVRDGQPIAGAAVSAMRAGRPPGPPSVSQPDGSFVLDGVPFGSTAFVAPPYGVRAPASLEVTRASIDDVTIEVGTLATVRGRVTRNGRAAPGAKVFVAALRQPEHTTTTDANGQFVIEGLPGGDAFYQANDFVTKAWALTKPVHLREGETTTLDIELDRAGEVKGVVVDDAGAPVPGVYVRLDAADGTADQCESIADAHGEFDCAMLMGGAYAPLVAPSPGTHLGFAPASGSTFDPISVPQDGVVTGIKLAIKAERLSIRGVVVDDAGATVPDVHVVAVAPGAATMGYLSAYSDASGRFTIDDLARGNYHVIAHAGDGGAGDAGAVSAGGEAVTIKIARPGAVAGTLAGFSGSPTVHVVLDASGGHEGELVSEPVIVEGATFSAIGLPPGRYRVEAISGPDTDGTRFDVRSGETTHVALRARARGRVEGRVLELGTNKPFAGWHCEALLSLDGYMDPEVPPDAARIASSDASGHYTVEAPVGRVRTGCVPQPGPAAPSWAGTDVEVTQGAVASATVYAVRPTYGTSPGNAGLELEPMRLPLTVLAVAPGGPAAAAGIVPGDRLVSIDGVSLDGVLAQGALLLLMNHHPGTTAIVGIERAGTVRSVKLTLASGPS